MGFSVKGESNLPGPEIASRLRVAIDEAGNVVGAHLVKRVKDGILNGVKSGRTYRRPGGGGTFTASKAPGEYSANVTGDLLNSINYRSKGFGWISFYATSGHAGYQEYGTSKMEARENLKRAIDESDGDIRAILDAAVRRALFST